MINRAWMTNTALYDARPARPMSRTVNPAHAPAVIAAIAMVYSLFVPVSPVIAQSAEPPMPSGVEAAAGAVDDDAGQAGFSEARRSDVRPAVRPTVGMSLEEALALVGDAPDSQEEVGAACGMLDVLTWDQDGTTIISVDGTVTSIVEGKKKQP